MRWLLLIAAAIGLWWVCRHWGRVSRAARRGFRQLAGGPFSVGAPIGGGMTPADQNAGPDSVGSCVTPKGCS